MNYNEDDIVRLRAQLSEALSKIPKRLNNASVQAVRSYREAHSRAIKVLNKRNATGFELQSALNEVS